MTTAQNGVREKNIYQDLARAAWIAPLAGLLTALLLSAAHVAMDSKLYGLPRAIVFFGLICALASFLGIPKFGPRGIVAPALAGLVLLTSVFGASTYFLRLARGEAQQRQELLRRATEASLNEFINSSGWLGAQNIFGGRLTISSCDSASNISQEFNAKAARRVTCVAIAFDNVAGSNAVTIDLSKIRMLLANGTQVDVLPPATVFTRSKEDSEKMAARFGGSFSIPAGGTSMDRLVFYPGDTDFAQCDSATIVVNGQPITVKGKFLTAEEKKGRFKFEIQTNAPAKN